jgi:hypothetical protein
MALLFYDGFDHYTADGATAGKYGVGGGGPIASGARTGVGSFRCLSTSSECTTKALTTSGGFIVGIAIYPGAASGGTTDLFQIREGASTIHLALQLNSSMQLVVKRNTTVLATGTTVIPLNAYTYVEFKGTIHDTTGSYEVCIDTVSEAALTATNVDTRNGGAGTWDRVRICAWAGNSFMDDFYVCDTSGSSPTNTFLGAVKVETLWPQTDAVSAGSNAGLTPSTGTDHGALVDETVGNTTDYNSSPTVGAKDTYQFPSQSIAGTVLGVQTNLFVAKSDAVARQVCAVVRAGGTDYDGASVSPTTTFLYYSEIRTLNPNTGVAWTTSDIASMQAGMKVTA